MSRKLSDGTFFQQQEYFLGYGKNLLIKKHATKQILINRKGLEYTLQFAHYLVRILTLIRVGVGVILPKVGFPWITQKRYKL